MTGSSLFRLTMQEFERRYLLAELRSHAWNRAQTARDLGLSYRALLYKITRLGLTAPASTEEYEPISA